MYMYTVPSVSSMYTYLHIVHSNIVIQLWHVLLSLSPALSLSLPLSLTIFYFFEAALQ